MSRTITEFFKNDLRVGQLLFPIDIRIFITDDNHGVYPKVDWKNLCPLLLRSSPHSSAADLTQVPLNEPLPGFPQPIYASTNDLEHETLVTTLSNGLRVASQNKFGQFCTVGDGHLIKMKALKFYKELKESEPSTSSRESNPQFSASTGWLTGFIKRHSFHNLKIKGEVASADEEAARKYPEKLAKIIKDGGYCAHQIFNAEETGLFWKKMPTRTYIAKSEKNASGFKAAKDRVTLLLCSNASGDRMLKPLLVNRSLKPRALKGKDLNTLPVHWMANKKAWVTTAIFTEWFNKCFVPEVENYMKEMGLEFKILLILDNAPVTSDIISIAKEIGGEGFDDFGEHDIEELLVDEALNDDDILEIVIDSGSRYETNYPKGISHFLEKLAFNATIQYNSKDEILQELEKHGGICDCQGSRDTLIYAASAYTSGLDPVISLLSEAVLRPQITEEEMDLARDTIQFELEDLSMKPDQEAILLELIHAAAYQNNTLGLPKLCPPHQVEAITRGNIYSYLRDHFTPSRMVVAGVGVEHQALVEAVSRHFVEKAPIWEQEASAEPRQQPDTQAALYTGGLMTLQKDLSHVSPGPTAAIPELAHLVVGLESSSHQDPDFIAFCTLNMLMGGGGSFSAGGPGKGMYSRLYTNVLNRYHWMYNATAYNHTYNDSGILCIHASSSPNQVFGSNPLNIAMFVQLTNLARVVIREIVNMAGPVKESELNRAKAQLQSMLLMNLEARPIMFEDIGRQVLATGHRKSPSHFLHAIATSTSLRQLREVKLGKDGPRGATGIGEVGRFTRVTLNDVMTT
ncbi:PMPCA [Cordylochernes scorpioides]|uniref:Alpha-MPP n=1 Tax=Cordylochernes scorpioides TaxID=51811 RepID=A0ABY6KW74_9ARAC|nr:PMPCA [Cordylochernes scorpioides]